MTSEGLLVEQPGAPRLREKLKADALLGPDAAIKRRSDLEAGEVKGLPLETAGT